MDTSLIGPLDDSLKLDAAATYTATNNPSGIDLGNGFTAGGAGRPVSLVLNVAALATDSDQTYACTLQQSDDQSTWVNAGPANVVTAAGSQAKVGGALTKRYARLLWTLGGTGPSITVTSYLKPATAKRRS
jgi:hypothetical protein